MLYFYTLFCFATTTHRSITKINAIEICLKRRAQNEDIYTPRTCNIWKRNVYIVLVISTTQFSQKRYPYKFIVALLCLSISYHSTAGPKVRSVSNHWFTLQSFQKRTAHKTHHDVTAFWLFYSKSFLHFADLDLKTTIQHIIEESYYKLMAFLVAIMKRVLRLNKTYLSIIAPVRNEPVQKYSLPYYRSIRMLQKEVKTIVIGDLVSNMHKLHWYCRTIRLMRTLSLKF